MEHLLDMKLGFGKRVENGQKYGEKSYTDTLK
jgi:hypothetical protein